MVGHRARCEVGQILCSSTAHGICKPACSPYKCISNLQCVSDTASFPIECQPGFPNAHQLAKGVAREAFKSSNQCKVSPTGKPICISTSKHASGDVGLRRPPGGCCRPSKGNTTRRSVLGVQWPSESAGVDQEVGVTAPEDDVVHVPGVGPAVDGSPTATLQGVDAEKKASFEQELQQFGEEVRAFYSSCKYAANIV